MCLSINLVQSKKGCGLLGPHSHAPPPLTIFQAESYPQIYQPQKCANSADQSMKPLNNYLWEVK